MKRLLIATLLAIGLIACVSAQEPVYYNSTPTVIWTPAASAPDGSAFLAGDTVEYRIYVWDTALLGFDPPPAIGLMDLRVTWVDTDPTVADWGITQVPPTAEEAQVISFADRRDWGVAVAGTHIDGAGNRTDYVGYLASSRAADTASGIPFVYVPLSGSATEPPGSGLRDGG